MAKGFSPCSIMGWNGTMISGIVACSSSGDDLGLVMSAMTNFDKPASSRTVSVKSFLRLVEVEDDGDIIPLAQLLAQPFQHLNSALGEAAEQKHAFLANGVDD